MTIIPRLIGASPTGTPAVDRKDDGAVMPIRAQATGSQISPPVGFRSRALWMAGLTAGFGSPGWSLFGPASGASRRCLSVEAGLR
jgi:hypothetical protein